MNIDLQGKTVSVVGRAGSIRGTGNGPMIDAADVVIRINWVLPIPEDQAPDVGTRTDLVYHCRRARTARVTANGLGVPTYRVAGKRRKKAARRHFKRPDNFRPTTGFMCVLDCLADGAAEVRLFGFDVFRSGHVQTREPDGDDYTRPLGWAHNPEEERLAWKALFHRNDKVIPDAILREAVK